MEDQREAARCGEGRRFRRASIAFHSALIYGSSNPLLISRIALVPWTARFSGLLAPERRRGVIAEHELIMARVCGHDPDGAERAARAHVRSSTAALEETLSPAMAHGSDQGPGRPTLPGR
jgi:DNA-binding GntR family transcriptional regulator